MFNKLKYALLFLMPFISCSAKQINNIDASELDYSDFTELKIDWSNLLTQNAPTYFAYIYSINCGHCKEIKADVFGAIEKKVMPFYLIEYNDVIPKVESNDAIVGEKDIDKIGIIGTPTLFKVSEQTITEVYVGSKEIKYTLNNLI